MNKFPFEKLKQQFDEMLNAEFPDYTELEKCLIEFENSIQNEAYELNLEDLKNYQNWFLDIIPKLELVKSTLVSQLGRIQQGKKALELYSEQSG